MTVKELRDELELYADNADVTILSANSGGYVDSVGGVSEKEILSFYGKDFDAVVLVCDSQIGAIRS